MSVYFPFNVNESKKKLFRKHMESERIDSENNSYGLTRKNINLLNLMFIYFINQIFIYFQSKLEAYL